MDIQKMMQQAQQMQEKMKKAQEEAANAEVTGEAGAGLVKVVMNGLCCGERCHCQPVFVVEFNSPPSPRRRC